MGSSNSKQTPSSPLLPQQPTQKQQEDIVNIVDSSTVVSNDTPTSSTTNATGTTGSDNSSTSTSSSSGCPMHRSDGTYSYNPWKILTGEFFTQHGPTGKQPLSKDEAESKTGITNSTIDTNTNTGSSKGNADTNNSISSINSNIMTSGGGCPVKHNNNRTSSTSSNSNNGCPVKNNSKNNNVPVEYNVYGQRIDPTNQMPYNPNQLPAYNQNIALSTTRVPSTIPKGGGINTGTAGTGMTETEATSPTTWLYPSSQMFYNALQRKNKLSDTDVSIAATASDTDSLSLQPQDIDSVVAIHNNMNEKTWYKILQWESIIMNQGNDITKTTTDNTDTKSKVSSPLQYESKLLKFQGRPMDLSPKAMIKHYLLGHPLPYDRHDWVVERTQYHTSNSNNNNKNNNIPPTISTQRYVIDYYYDSSKGRTDAESAIPHLHDRQNGSPSLLVDVRPAIDSFSALYHRTISMPYAIYVQPLLNKNSSNNRNDPTTTTSVDKNDTYEYLPLWPSSTMKSQVNESIQVWQEIQRNALNETTKTEKEDSPQNIADRKREELNTRVQQEIIDQFQVAMKSCQKEQVRMNEICSLENENTEDTKCAKASIDVTVCMGKVICPIQYEAFQNVITKIEDDTTTNTMIDDAYSRIQDCLAMKSKQYQQIKRMKQEQE